MTCATDIKKFGVKYEKRASLLQRKVAIELFKKVALKTPVDTGRARGNWMVGINVIPQASSLSIEKNPMPRIVQDIGLAKFGDTIAMANTLPYIMSLEYGGYPNPPKKGTWVKGTGKKGKRGKYLKGGQGHFEKRSSGGFSKQAPQGMVRTTVAEYSPTMHKALELVKREVP